MTDPANETLTAEEYRNRHMSEEAIHKAVVDWADRQAYRNHNQTLKQLANRGGLSPQEALALMNEKKWAFYRDTTDEAALLMLHLYGDDSEE